MSILAPLRLCCLCLVALLFFVGRPAAADCAGATAPLDKLICSTPELAAKDHDLNAKYQAAMALLSDAGKKYLRTAERQWLAMVRAYCGARLGKPETDGAGPVNCLRLQYDERLSQLDLAAKKVGPYILGRIEEIDFLASAPDDNYGSRSRLSYRDYSRPYIDSPVNAETTRWNEMIKQLADSGEADLAATYRSDDYAAKPGQAAIGTDTYVGYDIGLGSGDFLAVQFDVSIYIHREPHPHAEWLNSNYLMRQHREMSFAELFRADSNWAKVTAAACRQAVADDAVGNQVDPADCDDGIWSAWFPQADGLTVMLPMQPPVSQIVDVQRTVLKWPSLAPALSPSLPFASPVASQPAPGSDQSKTELIEKDNEARLKAIAAGKVPVHYDFRIKSYFDVNFPDGATLTYSAQPYGGIVCGTAKVASSDAPLRFFALYNADGEFELVNFFTAKDLADAETDRSIKQLGYIDHFALAKCGFIEE